MTREEIISMAREAGMSITLPRSGRYDGNVGGNVVDLTNFAKLVAEHERGECVKVCEELGDMNQESHNTQAAYGCDICADAVRARGTL